MMIHISYITETTQNPGEAKAYGMNIAALGGLLGGRDIGMKFIVKKSTDSDDVKVVKSVIDAMLQAGPRQRIKMQEVKKHLAGAWVRLKLCAVFFSI